MELAVIVYAISLLDNLKHVLVAITAIAGLASGGLAIAWMIHNFDTPSTSYMRADEADAKKLKWQENLTKISRLWKFVFGVFVAAGLLQIATPSERTAYMMVGAYTAQQVATSDVSKKVLAIVNTKIDYYFDEAVNQAEKKVTAK